MVQALTQLAAEVAGEDEAFVYLAGRRMRGRVALTLAGGAVAHRDRALAMVGA